MNPYLLLAIGIAWVGSLAATAMHFDRAARDSMLAASYEAGVKSTRKFNQYTAQDLQATRLAAEKDARARLRAQQIQHEFEMEAVHGTLLTVQPDPGKPAEAAGPVRISSAGLRLLNDAIAEYNASAVTPDGSPGQVPSDAAPPVRPGGGRPAQTAGLALKPSSSLRPDAR